MTEQALACWRERKPLVFALKQFGPEEFFQALDLKAHRSLSAVQNARSIRNSAGFDDGKERAQQGDVDIPSHCKPRLESLDALERCHNSSSCST
jgi:hypothetical protein